MPSLRYFVHLDAPGGTSSAAASRRLSASTLGNNENMAWGFTFAGIDEVDTFVEQTNPANPNETKYNDALGADEDHPRRDQGQGRGRSPASSS